MENLRRQYKILQEALEEKGIMLEEKTAKLEMALEAAEQGGQLAMKASTSHSNANRLQNPSKLFSLTPRHRLSSTKLSKPETKVRRWRPSNES